MDLALETFVTSKIRLKIMFKFFLNSRVKGYLRGLEREFGDSTNTIRLELIRFEKVGLLKSEVIQNRKYYSANTHHPFYSDINSIVKKSLGIDHIAKHITEIGDNVEAVWVTGDIAKGIDSKIIDLVIIGKNINTTSLTPTIIKIQKTVKRRIRYIVLTSEQMDDYFKGKQVFCILRKEA